MGRSFVLALAGVLLVYTSGLGEAFGFESDGARAESVDSLVPFESTEVDSLYSFRPPRPPRPRGVQCKAENERYVVFYGQGPNMPTARDAALRNCHRVSRRCYMVGCTPIR